MKEITTKTKFDIDDVVYGFPDNGLHKLVIDRIEMSIVKFGNVTQVEVYYLATTTDSKNNFQHRFRECHLFSEEEVKSYVNNYFKKQSL